MYIGNEPRFSSFPSKFFNGDGTAQTITLDHAPPSDSSLLVFIDGVRQNTSAYSLSGTSLTFTGTVPSGTNNVEVIHLGLQVDVGVVGDSTVTQAKLASGVAATDIQTQNIFFKNWATVSATQTTTIASTENAFIKGPITVADGATWTITGVLHFL